MTPDQGRPAANTGPSKAHRDWLMLAGYVPVHAALDIIVLNNFDVPGTAIYVVFVVNVVLAFATVTLVFRVFDRLRSSREAPAPEV